MLIFFLTFKVGPSPSQPNIICLNKMPTKGNDLRPLRVVSKICKSWTYARNFYMGVYPFLLLSYSRRLFNYRVCGHCTKATSCQGHVMDMAGARLCKLKRARDRYEKIIRQFGFPSQMQDSCAWRVELNPDTVKSQIFVRYLISYFRTFEKSAKFYIGWKFIFILRPSNFNVNIDVAQERCQVFWT